MSLFQLPAKPRLGEITHVVRRKHQPKNQQPEEVVDLVLEVNYACLELAKSSVFPALYRSDKDVANPPLELEKRQYVPTSLTSGAFEFTEHGELHLQQTTAPEAPVLRLICQHGITLTHAHVVRPKAKKPKKGEALTTVDAPNMPAQLKFSCKGIPLNNVTGPLMQQWYVVFAE